MAWIKALLKLPDLIEFVGKYYAKWKYKRAKVKMDRAILKAKKEGKTQDLQKEIGKHL